MKNRIIASTLAAALCAVMLCGCADKITDVPVSSNVGSSSSSSGYQSPSSSQTVQPKPEFSAAIGSSSYSSSVPSSAPLSSSEPTSSVVVIPPKSSSSTIPESSFSEPSPLVIPEPFYGNASILENYRGKWGYNHINSKQQKVYEKFYAASEKYDTSEIVVSELGVVTDDIYVAYWAFDHDNPQFLELGSGYQMKISGADKRTVMGVSILFGRSPSKISHSEFDRVAKDVISQTSNEATDYDKLLFIHDWLVNNTVYTSKNKYYEYEADGPVVHQKAVCEGYAKAFMYFAQSVGIECVCVIGKANGEQHMWNMVNLYGCWYHVDVTWDDPKTNDGSNVLRHKYFLLSDRDIGETHEIEEVFTLPSAPNTYVQ